MIEWHKRDNIKPLLYQSRGTAWSKPLLVRTKSGRILYGATLISENRETVHDWFYNEDFGTQRSEACDDDLVVEYAILPDPSEIALAL